jgi:hypothetical protein
LLADNSQLAIPWRGIPTIIAAMKRWQLWLAAAVLAAIALLLGAVVRQRQPVVRMLLPTGESVSVAGASFGTNHTVPGRYPLERRLPAPLRRVAERLLRLGPPPPDRQTTEPLLVIWLTLKPGLATNTAPGATWCYATLEDAAGLAGGSEQHLPLFGAAVQSLQTVEFQAFPRRGKQFFLALTQDLPGSGYGSPRALLGKLPVRNPTPVTTPAWSVPDQTVATVAGGLEASPEGFLVGVGQGTSHSSQADGSTRLEFDLARTNTPPGAAILLRLQQAGGSSNHWTVGDLSTADATGNLMKNSSSSWGRISDRDPRVHFRWSPVLWPNEAWELRVLAKREADAAFAPEELIEFRDVALPAPGATNHYEHRTVQLPAAGARHGSNTGFGLPEGSWLRLDNLERQLPAAENDWSDRSATRLRLTASGWTNGLYLDLVRATDERGHEVKSGSRGFGMNQGKAEFTYSFRSVPADARQLNLRFAIHRGVPLTFRVDPSRPLTNATFGLKR